MLETILRKPAGQNRASGFTWVRRTIGVGLLIALTSFGFLTEVAAQRADRAEPVWQSQKSFFGLETTTRQKALFATFAASTCVTGSCPAGQLDTAISISNTLSGPPGVQEVFDALFEDLEGTIEVYLWDSFGHLLMYETAVDSPGIGLIRDEPEKEGFLAPGQTWRVLLSQILAEVDYATHEMVFDHQDGVFAGYMWIVANFDGVQGTTNLTDFATFTQSLVLQPDLGTTFFDFDADAGVPIVDPEEPPQ